MDDAMFEGLTKGLDQGPIGANVVLNSASAPTTVMPVGYTAEPAQVMVMVQNTRAVQAETKLATLKTAVAGIIGLVIIVLFAVVYFFLSRRKKPEYKGIELPGAPLQDIQKGAPQMMPQPSIQQPPLAHQPPLVQQPSMQPFGADRPNVVRVHGPIPLWTSEDSRDEPEPRVSESDSSIASLVKQREIFTKDLELSMAQAQTQQQR